MEESSPPVSSSVLEYRKLAAERHARHQRALASKALSSAAALYAEQEKRRNEPRREFFYALSANQAVRVQRRVRTVLFGSPTGTCSAGVADEPSVWVTLRKQERVCLPMLASMPDMHEGNVECGHWDAVRFWSKWLNVMGDDQNRVMRHDQMLALHRSACRDRKSAAATAFTGGAMDARPKDPPSAPALIRLGRVLGFVPRVKLPEPTVTQEDSDSSDNGSSNNDSSSDGSSERHSEDSELAKRTSRNLSIDDESQAAARSPKRLRSSVQSAAPSAAAQTQQPAVSEQDTAQGTPRQETLIRYRSRVANGIIERGIVREALPAFLSESGPPGQQITEAYHRFQGRTAPSVQHFLKHIE